MRRGGFQPAPTLDFIDMNRRTIIEGIVALAILALLFVLLNPDNVLGEYKLRFWWQNAYLWLGIVVGAFVVLGIHELGHLLVGLREGFQFQLFVVGPLGVRRGERGIEWYLNRDVNYYGGVAATSPRTDAENNATKFARVLLAGPLASLLLGVALILLAWWLHSGVLAMVVYTAGMISFAIFVATTVPSRTGAFYTDRARYQRLTQPGIAQEEELAILHLMGSYAQHNSYRHVQPDRIDQLTRSEDDFMRYYGWFNQVAYEHQVIGSIDELSLRRYRNTSRKVSPAMVKVFDQELTKLGVVLPEEVA